MESGIDITTLIERDIRPDFRSVNFIVDQVRCIFSAKQVFDGLRQEKIQKAAPPPDIPDQPR